MNITFSPARQVMGSIVNKLSGDYEGSNYNLDVNLVVIIFEEEGMYYTYCPSLDIMGYGKTEPEARDSFTTMLDEFFEYTIKKKTLRKVLKDLGWSIRKSKKKPIYPPNLEDLAKHNPELSEILNNKNYRSSKETVSMPV